MHLMGSIQKNVLAHYWLCQGFYVSVEKQITMNKSILKYISPLINVTFLLVCLLHICINGFYMIHPDLPSIRVSENNLKDINFPLSFRICVTEIENSTKRYENVGYEGEFAFFSGKRMYEPKNLYGFAGHTNNGSTLSDVQGWYLFIQYLHYLILSFRNTT